MIILTVFGSDPKRFVTSSFQEKLMGVNGTEVKEDLSPEIRDQVTEPPMYSVLLHNDDYTTMEFVVEVLMYVFNKAAQEATRIMLDVHRQGIGVCGRYTHEVAETKVDTVQQMAREEGFPLKCTMEKA